MATDLEKLKEIYLGADVDEETRAENLKEITDWENALIKNENMRDWQAQDITKEISHQAQSTYREITLQLGTNRKLTEPERFSLWAKQDAALWIISMTMTNAKDIIEQINGQIKAALAVT